MRSNEQFVTEHIAKLRQRGADSWLAQLQPLRSTGDRRLVQQSIQHEQQIQIETTQLHAISFRLPAADLVVSLASY
ncbi:hypothetical protein AQZ49_05320 [Novosphingobium sp. FSW06-99]|nr:hypothetical protein AQZ49_05320 [Novosphingobium sp. FSW06-99]